MRIFFILSVALAVAIGWFVAAPTRPSYAPPVPTRSSSASSEPTGAAGWPGTLEIKRNPGGHFMAAGSVNGNPLTFVVDTGASGVVLGRGDAARAGVMVDDATFNGEARTAGGTIRVAHVRLARVRVGTIELPDVAGIILDVDGTLPLLGQSFLSRIDKVAIERDRMTLTKL